MAGDNHRVLVNTSILWPNGIAFDLPSDRLFWADAHYDTLSSVKLDGTLRVTVKPDISTAMSLKPFSIAVFEDTIFWSDFDMQDIQSCQKFTGQNHKVVVKTARVKTAGITLWHPLLKPLTRHNPCETKTCEQICLIKEGGWDAECKCSKDYDLVHGHSCKPKKTFIQKTLTGLRDIFIGRIALATEKKNEEASKVDEITDEASNEVDEESDEVTTDGKLTLEVDETDNDSKLGKDS